LLCLSGGEAVNISIGGGSRQSEYQRIGGIMAAQCEGISEITWRKWPAWRRKENMASGVSVAWRNKRIWRSVSMAVIADGKRINEMAAMAAASGGSNQLAYRRHG